MIVRSQSGCTPGINCQQSTNYDPAAEVQPTTPNTCTYPVNGINGYVCQLNSSTSLNECLDMYTAGVTNTNLPMYRRTFMCYSFTKL